MRVGTTEQELAEKGVRYEIGKVDYRDNARAQLVGVHLSGECASELVHIGMAAMQLGGPIDTFIAAVYNCPTLSELFKYAAYDGLQRLAKRGA